MVGKGQILIGQSLMVKSESIETAEILLSNPNVRTGIVNGRVSFTEVSLLG